MTFARGPEMKSKSRLKSTPGLRWSGRLLVLLLALALTSGCVTGLGKSVYQVKMPLLGAEPRVFACGDQTCIAILKQDYDALVRELKTACLAAGQSSKECQTDE